MNTFDGDDSSDSSDEDYVPEKDTETNVREEDCDNESDDLDDEDIEGCNTKKRKRTKNSRNKKLKTEEENNEADRVEPAISEEEKKKQDDDLWADFMKDTGFQSKKSNAPTTKVDAKPSKSPVTVKQTFHFAGEEVIVEKNVPNTTRVNTEMNKMPATKSKSTGGLGGLLSQLGKKSKLSVLEKSQLDWNKYKKEEKLEEELKTFNKGKEGYLERQDFLTRTDLRSFEIEKNLRSIERSKRLT